MARDERSAIRASDADRERVADRLREHYSAGRLDDAELDDRVAVVQSARTAGELDAVMRDLPEASPPAAPARREPRPRRHVTRGGRVLRTSVKIHAAVFLAVNLLLVVVWALTGGGAFWPLWSIAGWGVGLAGHWAPVAAGVGTRPARPRVDPATAVDVAASVARDRPSLRPAAAPDGTVTVLFSDIVGSTALNDRLGDARWIELLREHHRVLRSAIEAHGGFEVKTQGDGFMVAFPSARRAIGCALAMHENVAGGLAGERVVIRVGLHTGEAIREDEDFYGRNVALAARVADAADAGEVLVSATVHELVASTGDLVFGAPRDVELKGLGTQRVFPVTSA